MKAAGDLAKGVYFITTGGSVTNDPSAITDPLAKFEATTFQTKPIEYGMDKSDLFKGFGVQRVQQPGQHLGAEHAGPTGRAASRRARSSPPT